MYVLISNNDQMALKTARLCFVSTKRSFLKIILDGLIKKLWDITRIL